MFSSQNSQVSGDATYIEDVFSTYLYTGNGSSSTRSITTGVDSSTYGSLVWIKNRTVGGTGRNNYLTTTALSNAYLLTNTTDAAVAQSAPYPVDPTSTGFNLNSSGSNVNTNGQDYVSWTFRKQPKFFDVVTYTGNGTAGRQIAHNLGSVPGCIIVKCTGGSSGESWNVYHRSMGNNALIYLDGTDGKFQPNSNWNNTDPTSTAFTVSGGGGVNYNGFTYVAYLFAHDAGGFGLTGTDNVISCGSYTGTGANGNNVTLGYEPQWLLIKRTNSIDPWLLFDNMRGMSYSDNKILYPNYSQAEDSAGGWVSPTATGFVLNNTQSSSNGSGSNYIYIAIRRGPMKVPTDATKVFSPVAQAGGGTVTSNFPVDLVITTNRNGVTGKSLIDRLRGASQTSFVSLDSNSTAAEVTASGFGFGFDNNTGYRDNGVWSSGQSIIYENFRRAPSFFDEVCYTGTGSATTVTHNLGVAPELMIVKSRSGTGTWNVYAAPLGATAALYLETTGSIDVTGRWNSTAPTSTVFSISANAAVNASGVTYVAYLFATCAGVSKVFSYTGNGSSQTINCGFTAGARWILIKRTDSTGDWYVWDSARGIVSGNDPHLSLNTTAAEVTTDDTIDTDSTGFVVNQVSATNVNVSSATYIGIAIA